MEREQLALLVMAREQERLALKQRWPESPPMSVELRSMLFACS